MSDQAMNALANPSKPRQGESQRFPTSAPDVNEPRPRSAAATLAKRLYDVGFASVGLIALSPVFLLIALAIKLCDRGAVFYRQKRIGQGGVPFMILKFRSMVSDADKHGPP